MKQLINSLSLLSFKGLRSLSTTLLATGCLFSAYSSAFALTFSLPSNGNIVGHVQSTTVQKGEDVSSIGLKYGIGGYEMKEANPKTPYLAPRPGTKMVIPSKFVLPSAPKKNIVINLAEMRLYYYTRDKRTVMTYPIGIGKSGWQTPMGKTKIMTKRKDPTWNVPESIWNNRLMNGNPIDKVWPPGPNNPLGRYAMNLGFKNIVIHGTPYPKGVGLRSSHGCIRMLNSHIEQLFQRVRVGTPVNIVHEPVKVGYLGNEIYLESHLPLTENNYPKNANTKQLVNKVAKKVGGRLSINWRKAEELRQRSNGYPEPIGKRI